jgi:ATP-dependent Lon protease
MVLQKSGIKKKNHEEIRGSVKNKCLRFQKIITKTIQHIQNNKFYKILSIGDVNLSIQELQSILFETTKILKSVEFEQVNDNNSAQICQAWVDGLKKINHDLSSRFKKHGTQNLEDFIEVCFDTNYQKNNLANNLNYMTKYDVLKDFFHPTSYKAFTWASLKKSTGKKGTITEDFELAKMEENLFANPYYNLNSSFQENINSVKVVFHDSKQKLSMVIIGLLEDVPLSCISNTINIIHEKVTSLHNKKTQFKEAEVLAFQEYIKSVTIKDTLIYTDEMLLERFHKYLNSIRIVKNHSLQQIIKSYLESPLLEKREMILQLLVDRHNNESEYMAYLLYDLLSLQAQQNSNLDSNEQHIIYESLPLSLKQNFKEAMAHTLSYTEELYNFSSANVPLEQQICLLKANDAVKEKAIVKLKEIKAKSEDTGSKARNYLEGLLRIPFGQYKKEEVLSLLKKNQDIFHNLLDDEHKNEFHEYSLIFMRNKLAEWNTEALQKSKNDLFAKLQIQLTNSKRDTLIENVKRLNSFKRKNNIKFPHLSFSGKTRNAIKEQINGFLNNIKENPNDESVIEKLCKSFLNENIHDTSNIEGKIQKIRSNMENMTDYISHVQSTLDNSVFGHSKAKRQVQRIIGQWMVGENKGYCFGFEGPPGVGKTSLAQNGISKCLVDANGSTRPFAFIAMGGSSNGSTLEGHNYTYVGSTWGKIVDILMECKCMNPIIFIDELDKISKTENGKEIIGILTHLIDSSQNNHFQDKYFNGVDLDLSKALFIFSYNDVSLIDRILLDRIHRIKFDRLTMIDKQTITQKYLLPEILEKLNMKNDFVLSNDVVRFIVNTYTNEPGVRKLKEILFELFSEMNLELLNFKETPSQQVTIPIVKKYLRERQINEPQMIAESSAVGVINGLWANTYGCGGILSIEGKFVNATNFLDLKLTGQQGDVMKESMSVALTTAWNLLTTKEKDTLREKLEKEKTLGIHIHCPDGATPKDGPSAGTAITILLYSLFTGRKIKNYYAITGEMNLQERVTKIGGLDCKFIGGIEAGVTHFIYPKENEKEYEDFIEKYDKDEANILEGIQFFSAEKVQDAMKHLLE